MYHYQNVSDQELTIPNVGVVAPNGTIQSEVELINSNLKPITTQAPSAPSVPTPPVPAVVQPAVQAAPEPSKEEN
jgi:hypothetical protein